MNWAEVNGVSLRYDWRGGDGIPLVLVHEMGGTLESWTQVMDELPAGRPVLRLDIRGAGLSEKPAGPLSIEDLAQDVVALMDHAGIGVAHLAGCAVGAGVCVAAAAILGPRAAVLTLMAPALGVPPERKAGLRALAASFRENGVRGFLERDTFPKAWPADTIPRGVNFALFRAIQMAASPEMLARTYEMLAEIDLRPVLEKLACPVHVVAGRYDVARTPEILRGVAERARRGSFSVIDSGHFMPLQSPAAVAALLSEDPSRDFHAA